MTPRQFKVIRLPLWKNEILQLGTIEEYLNTMALDGWNPIIATSDNGYIIYTFLKMDHGE